MPTGRIVALIVDRPGGPLDKLIADPDVSTFLNDRFDAHFVHPEEIGVPGSRTVLLTPEGCPRSEAIAAATPAAWIASVNAALETPPGSTPAGRLPGIAGVLDDHPLARPCSTSPR